MYKPSVLTFGKMLTFTKKLFQFSTVCRKANPPHQPTNVPKLSYRLYPNWNIHTYINIQSTSKVLIFLNNIYKENIPIDTYAYKHTHILSTQYSVSSMVSISVHTVNNSQCRITHIMQMLSSTVGLYYPWYLPCLLQHSPCCTDHCSIYCQCVQYFSQYIPCIQNIMKSIVSFVLLAFVLLNLFCNDRILLFHTAHTCIQPYLGWIYMTSDAGTSYH